jgi:hypothetical protein
MNGEPILKPWGMFVAMLVLTLMLGVTDWVSGYELQFFIFYFLPIGLTAWICGAGLAYALAVVSAAVWFTADLFSGHPYTHPSYAFWNTAIRLASFVIVGYSMARIRSLLMAQRKIADDLQKAMSEVKTLTGLLPICASCKKIRDDSGYWHQLEVFIEKRSGAQFTHGLCQQCASKYLQDAGLDMDEIKSIPRNVSELGKPLH